MKDYNFFLVFDKKRGARIDPKSSNFIAVIVIILCVLLSVGLVARNFVLLNRLTDINTEIEVKIASSEYTEANRLKMSIDAMKQYDEISEEIVKKFQEADVLGTEIMGTLTSVMPTSVTLNSISINNAAAGFVFAAPDRKAAAELLLNLKNSGLFQEVELNTITSDPNSSLMNVTINAVMKAGEAE